MTASTTAKKPRTPAKAAVPKAAKPSAKPAVAPKPALAAAKLPTPMPAPTPEAAVQMPALAKGATLKMKDLIAQVTDAAGGKKKGVKEIVEATLAALGTALSKGDAINLPGFGRARVAHAEDKGAGKPMTIKLKTQSTGGAKKPGKQGLADAEDEG